VRLGRLDAGLRAVRVAEPQPRAGLESGDDDDQLRRRRSLRPLADRVQHGPRQDVLAAAQVQFDPAASTAAPALAGSVTAARSTSHVPSP
jgi:hypothetical protein